MRVLSSPQDIEPSLDFREGARFRFLPNGYMHSSRKIIEVGLKLARTDEPRIEDRLHGRMLQAAYAWQCGERGKETTRKILEEVTPFMIGHHCIPFEGRKFDFVPGGLFDEEKGTYNGEVSSDHKYHFALVTKGWLREFRNFLMEQNMSAREYLKTESRVSL